MRRMMREMGMSEAEIVRHEMMMRLDVKTSDPAALLALREHLGLNEEQVHRLGVLREKTQAEALQALDEEQRKKVEALPAEPRTVAAMRGGLRRGLSVAPPG